MARSSAVAAGVVGLGAAAALAVLGARGGGGGGAKASLDPIVTELDLKLRETAAGVHSRATTLADLPRLKYAVGTDAETVMDLRKTERGFELKPGETIEIAQSKGGRPPAMLLRLPAESKARPPMDKPGAHALALGRSLLVSEVVKVEPLDPPEPGIVGAIAVTATVDLAAIESKLVAIPTARLLVGDEVVAGSADPFPQGAALAEARPSIEWARDVRIAAVGGGAGPNVALLAGAGASALLGILGMALLWRRAGAPASPPAQAAQGSALRSPASPAPDAFAATAMAAQATPPPSSRAATPVPGGGSAALAVAPSPSAIMAHAGGVIGRYTLVKSLGTGGMAEVWLARATGEAGFEKLLAVKVIHRHLAQDATAVEHFLDEARIASRLTHPNIVQIVDLGRAGDDYYIAMEYIEGRDLQSLLETARKRKAQVPVRVALHLIRKVCDGLEAAHNAVGSDGSPLGIVHRDIKTANVLLSRAGAVKVGDFGIAKANQQIHKTEIGQTKGTAAYMAPEQRMGKLVDRRADVFAVGAIAYELVTGAEVNLDLANLFHLGLEGWPHLPPPSQLRPELPKELDALIFKALAFEPEQRFATCGALEEALEKIIEQHGLATGDKQIAQWVAELA